MEQPDVPEPIVINSIDNTTKHIHEKGITARMLDGCYFYPMGDGTYNLYSKADVLLKDGIEPNESGFSFDFGPFNWVVSEFSLSEELPSEKWTASGTWTASVLGTLSINPPGTQQGDGEGTFQAQGGGHGGPEEKAAAASSY